MCDLIPGLPMTKIILNTHSIGTGLVVSEACFFALCDMESNLLRRLPYAQWAGIAFPQVSGTWPPDDAKRHWTPVPLEGRPDWYTVGSRENCAFHVPTGPESATWVYLPPDNEYPRFEARTHPDLVGLIDQHGYQWASGTFGVLKVVEIPDDVQWQIESDGHREAVVEKHHTWS